MSKNISFGLRFPADRWPGSLLLDLLHDDFSSFIEPQMGRIKVGDNVLDVGPRPYEMVYETTPLFEGEEMVLPGITTLTGHPDATPEITDFLSRVPQNDWSVAELVGNCHLDCVDREGKVSQRFFRSGNEIWIRPIVWFRVSNFMQTTHIMVNITCPWFFLKDWWPEDIACSSSGETAERNWGRLVDFVHLIARVGGENRLDEIDLDLEGSVLFRERGWLNQYAQRLPKLTVYYP